MSIPCSGTKEKSTSIESISALVVPWAGVIEANAGGVAMYVIVIGVDGSLGLPATSVATKVIVFWPGAKGKIIVNTPAAFAVVDTEAVVKSS